MKKLLFAISAFALLTGLSTSCQKDIDPLQEGNQNTEFTITATIADNTTKVSYEEDGTTHALKPSWQVGDVIIGFDGNSNTYGYSVSSVDGTTKTAVLTIITTGDYVGSKTTNPGDGTKMYMIYAPGKKPSDISEKSLTVSLASQSKDTVPALMMASATVSGSSLSLAFTNKTAIIAIKNPTMAAASTEYTSIALSGTGVNTDVVFNLDGSSNLQASYQTPGTITKTVEFTSDASTKKGADVTYIVACPLSTAADLTFTASNGEKFSKASKTISVGNYYYMTPTFAPGLPEGALSGEFSVSATTKVHFSKGNMYYDGSAFQFEANQYSSASTWSTTHVSHFYWSKTASVAYAEAYSESEKSADDVFFTNGTTTTPNSEFTVNGAKGAWRTLSGGSSGEWQYLLSTRSVNGGTGEGKSYQRATINSDATGVYGVIIYPDNYTSQTTATSYTSSQWTAMESAGCVFLPAAGFRNDSDVYKVGDYGLYSSSTACGEDDAYGLFFYSDDFKPHNSDIRDNGCSVRLVCAAQ